MKSKIAFVLISMVIFLIGCAPIAQTATETPVPPTATATKILPTATETVIPTATATPTPQISADEMNAVISSVDKNLTGGFRLTANPDSTYSISRPDGTAVKNIVLDVDGKFHVTQTDGTEIAIDPSTFFMPSADKIYAELQQIDVATGNVGAIDIASTIGQTGKDTASISGVTISSGRYKDWADAQSKSTTATFFASLDSANFIKWVVGKYGLHPHVINGINEVFSGTGLIPTGLKSYPDSMPFDQYPSSKDVPSAYNFSFVNLVGHSPTGADYKGVSINTFATYEVETGAKTE